MAVIGLGLIGGSLARALARSGCDVIGLDAASVCRRAIAAKAIARRAASPEEAARLAGVVVLAAPPDANRNLLARLARVAPPGLVVTDVGSVKGPICRDAARLALAGFVGGHPMAGNERAGFGASSADLFRGRPWILTPGRPAALARIRAIVRAVGARPVVMDPETHDRVAAFLSHLPQLLAWALTDAVASDPVARRHRALAGPGFAGMTRLAASPRPLWREILRDNRVEVRRAVRAMGRALARGRR